MKKLILFLNLFLFIPISITSLYAQNISTEGTDFWLGFMENHETSQIDLEIFISAADTTTGIVEMPYYNWSSSFVTYPGITAKVTVPTNYAMSKGSGLVANKGIHISAENNVSVYALNKRSKSSDATVILPSISLGKEYLTMAHMESNGGGPSLYAEILVVAVSDETELIITPSVLTTDGKVADQPFQITLDQGQSYQLQSELDLTGTKIETVNSELGDCKNFAVFGGNEWTRVGSCNGAQDNLYEQMFPVNTWGKAFVSIPYKTRLAGDMLKILAAEDSTTFTINGTLEYMLDAGEFKNLTISYNAYIESDKPISIGQFSRSQSCDGVPADPFFIMLSPLEQRLKKVTFNALEIHVVDRYYLNVIVPADGINSTILNGINISDSLTLVNDNEDYAYAQMDITEGNHTLECAEGFIAYVYGYGNIESFGYATGVSLQNLNLKIESAEPGSDLSIKKDSTCIDDPVEFSVDADSSFIFFDWDFADGNYATGKTVVHSFDQEGIYAVKVTANTSQGACSSEETSIKYIHVVKPKIDVYGPRSVCPNASQIEYNALGDSRNTYEWFVEGGTITSDNLADNVLVDWGVTNSEAYIKIVPRNYLGCYGDTLNLNVKINIQLEPSAPFGMDSLCSDLAGEIEYEAYLANGSIYDWHTDFGDILVQGNHITQVSWDGPGTGMLWFEESSILDDVCSGWSDTLSVYIERAPDEHISIVGPDYKLYNGDSIPINIDADSAYQFFSWNFGDGHIMDSIPRSDDTVHIYPCNSSYLVEISAYTGTVCQNTGIGSKPIEINAPELEMLYVSNDTSSNKDLHLGWEYMGSPNYQQPISLWRKQTFPDVSAWELIQDLHLSNTSFVDQQRPSDSTIYQYKVETNYACKDTTRSFVHHNILLTAIEIESDSSTQIKWNNYSNWENGVQHYEIWRKVDDSDYAVIGLSNSTEGHYSYDYDGFDFCYRVRAIEMDGNYSTSWSNETCVDFVPSVKTYNFFSPNDDNFNQYLTFENIEIYPQSVLTVYNRYGKNIKSFTNYLNNWDGKVNGKLVAAGVYYYQLKLNEPRNELNTIRGYFTVMY